MLDNGYNYPVDARLHAFADTARWAMVIEVVGYSYKAGCPTGMQDILHCFGNCLHRPPGTVNEDFLSFVNETPGSPIFDSETGTILQKAQSLLVRGRPLRIPRDPEVYRRKGIALEDPSRLQPFQLMRALVPEHRESFLATEEELRERVPADLPLILRLEEWHHPDVARRELPSQSSTFQMLAEVLRTNSRQPYRPIKPSNTHWSNWPEGGTL
jgi:hypothetical protein